MNNRQEYPEKLEDYQIELMSASGLVEDNSHDFELELMKMEDATENIDTAKQNQPKKGNMQANKNKNREKQNHTNHTNVEKNTKPAKEGEHKNTNHRNMRKPNKHKHTKNSNE